MALLLHGCAPYQEETVTDVENPGTFEGNKAEYNLAEGDSLEYPTGIDDIYYVYNSNSGKSGLYDCAAEEYVVESKYMSIGPFSAEGIAAVCENGYFGYINSKGEVVIDFYYSTADEFQDGHAIVSTERGFGVIDQTGDYTVNPQYKTLRWLNESLLQYTTEDSELFGFCDANGVERSLPEYENFLWKGAYLFAKTEDGEDCYQVFDENGTPLFGEGSSLPQVDYIMDNDYGLYRAQCQGTSEPTRFGFVYSPSQMYDEWYSYLNKDFQLLPGDPYQEAGQFNFSGYAVVSVRQDWWGHETWGVIDSSGNYICDLPEPHLGRAGNGYTETNGYLAIAWGYTGSVGMGTESYYAVVDIATQEMTEYQTIDFIEKTKYTMVQDLSTNLYGLYDKDQLVKECVYDSIEVRTDGKMILRRGGSEEVYGGRETD